MRRLAALALAAFASAASAQAPAPGPTSPARARRVRIAVLDLGSFGIEEKERALLSEVALTAAGASKLIETIGKSDVAALLGFEKQKQMMGCGDDFSCIAEVGGALGAEYILTGSVGNIGELHRVDVKLVEVKKARVASRAGETVSGGVASLVAAVQRSVRQALLPIDPALAPPPPSPPGSRAGGSRRSGSAAPGSSASAARAPSGCSRAPRTASWRTPPPPRTRPLGTLRRASWSGGTSSPTASSGPASPASGSAPGSGSPAGGPRHR